MGKNDNTENEREFQKGVSRRGFLRGSLIAAVGAASAGLLAGCGTKTATLQSSGQTQSADWLGQPPNIADSDIKQTLQADVVIVGSGVAGLNAARAASEAGSSVIVIEKGATYQFRSGQYGAIDSKIQKAHGIKVNKNAAILENMKQMGYRADQRMWKYWADHSGADFDWLLELAPDVDVIPQDAVTYDESKITLQILHFPEPSAYDPANEYSPAYPTAMTFLPDQGKILKRVYQRCLDKGCKFLFATWARKLIRPNNQGRVEGVICQDKSGVYTKVLAKKGVILATGDYGNNKDMIAHFVPWVSNVPDIYQSRDAKTKISNIGEGHKMGVWAGAKMEDGPHAPMVHTLGGPLGVDAFFLANTEGKRFVNEDVGGQQLSSAVCRQPGNFGWQIFDDKWPDQIGFMGSSHGSVNYCVSPDKNPNLKNNFAIGKTPYISREDLKATEGIVIADSLSDLVNKLELDSNAQKTLLESVKRYNELCSKGVDEDFGKVSKRLFPITNPPFYAAKIQGGAMLVCMGGLTCNPETGNVLDKDYKGIEGLYAAGNTMGGRFLVDYPVVTPGVSHAFALVYGRLVGSTVAAL